MSAFECIQENASDEKNFNGNYVYFPDVVDDKIKTKEFLAAARHVLVILEKFGTLFAPVKYDMQGNIEKLSKKYNDQEETRVTLQDMILLEKESGEIIATDALMWLRRGLHMILLFLEEIVNDNKAGNATEDLAAFLKKSYKETLEPYHGWMAQQLFGLLSRMVPSRTRILCALADEQENRETATLRELDAYLKTLRSNVVNLCRFYNLHNLENTSVV